MLFVNIESLLIKKAKEALKPTLGRHALTPLVLDRRLDRSPEYIISVVHEDWFHLLTTTAVDLFDRD
jgi:hypothetical protein